MKTWETDEEKKKKETHRAPAMLTVNWSAFYQLGFFICWIYLSYFATFWVISLLWRAGLAQWSEHSFSGHQYRYTAQVRFPDEQSYVDWVCWLSTLFLEVLPLDLMWFSLICILLSKDIVSRLEQLRIYTLYKWKYYSVSNITLSLFNNDSNSNTNTTTTTTTTNYNINNNNNNNNDNNKNFQILLLNTSKYFRIQKDGSVGSIEYRKLFFCIQFSNDLAPAAFYCV